MLCTVLLQGQVNSTLCQYFSDVTSACMYTTQYLSDSTAACMYAMQTKCAGARFVTSVALDCAML